MGRKFSSTNTFSPMDSNTICDVTGFKVKLSETRKRWDGLRVIGEAWHPRQPQDTPVIPTAQKVFPEVRTENLDTDDVESFDPV
jgi:hypothetical protein